MNCSAGDVQILARGIGIAGAVGCAIEGGVGPVAVRVTAKGAAGGCPGEAGG